MAPLTRDMDHRAAAAHLRQEVVQTAEFETGRLVTPREPGFFGAVRGVMCDLDYLAALYYGWNGHRRDQIATKTKTVRFIRTQMSAATGDDGYRSWAGHLYELYRHGLVHLRAPKVLFNQHSSPPRLGWALMYPRDAAAPGSTGTRVEHLVLADSLDGTTAVLPVSIRALFDDFLATVQAFAAELDHENAGGGHERLSSWRQTANALSQPEATSLTWHRE